MNTVSFTPWEKAVTHLLILALFFAMRSCEYLETRYPEESRRTKILRCKNFVFKKNGSILSQACTLQILESADLIIITFEFQKNDWRNHTVHMFATNDLLLCPVRASARIIHRVRLRSGSNNELKICSFTTEDGTSVHVNSAQVLPRLRVIVELIGKEKLGFTKDDIGLHSIRSGGAMTMFLSGVSVIIIKRIGRWSSEAFLEYIREQVENFTYGVSMKMLMYENFHTINAGQDHDQLQQNDVFVKDKDGIIDPVTIEHEIFFSKLSLT